MILGLDRNPAAQCFAEIDEVVRQLRGKDDVVFGANACPEEIPAGAVVYNFENIGTNGVEARADAYEGHELWDFSARNCEAWKAAGREVKHAPVGYHPSMKRFARAADPDIDVVHVGCLNERRKAVLEMLVAYGHQVVHLEPGIYGAERDAVLARARLVVVPMFYDGGVFCSLRAAHLHANRVPCLFETAPEIWSCVDHCHYMDLARCAHGLLSTGPGVLPPPMVLP